MEGLAVTIVNRKHRRTKRPADSLNADQTAIAVEPRCFVRQEESSTTASALR